MDTFRPETCGGCLTHYGFTQMWDTFREEMHDYIHSLVDQYPTASILVTGHSLGAALSTVAAYDTKIEFPNTQLFLYNMGSPRVGNTAFYTKFKELF